MSGRKYWGWNDATYYDNVVVPEPVILPANLSKEIIRSVKAGSGYAVILSTSGKVLLWGEYAPGYGGYYAFKDSNGDIVKGEPANAATIAGLPFIEKISAGVDHVLALDANGKVWSWGVISNGPEAGEEGPNVPGMVADKLPKMVPIPGTVVEISAGIYLSVALTSDGKVFVWGNRWLGQRGDDKPGEYGDYLLCNDGWPDYQGGADYKKSCGISKPVEIKGVNRIIKISTDGGHILALREDGALLVWGENSFGEAGTGTFDNSNGVQAFFNPVYTSIPVLMKPFVY